MADMEGIQDKKNIFQIFPELIWQEIFYAVDEPDIPNLLTAFPALLSVLNGNQCTWLIGAVMPLLFPKYLNRWDIKRCRLVSKRWRDSIGRTISTHPDRLPYNSPRLSTITKSHFNYSRLPTLSTQLYSLKQENGNLESCAPQQKNPFLSGTAHVTLTYDYDDEDIAWMFETNDYDNFALKLCEVVPILKIYGSHILDLTVEVLTTDLTDHEVILCFIFKKLFEGLSYLPNLKSLTLPSTGIQTIHSSFHNSNGFVHIIPKFKFPFRLETLKLFADCEYFINLYPLLLVPLVNHCHVKKLVLQVEYWRKEYASLFPNLTELCLKGVSKPGLQNILQDLSSSPLRKLRIDAPEIKISTEDILEILSCYQIESLELFGSLRNPETCIGAVVLKSVLKLLSSEHTPECGKWDNNILRNTLIVPSVRSLSFKLFQSSHISFKLLKHLPNLHYLTIRISYFLQSHRLGLHADVHPFAWYDNINNSEIILVSLHKFFTNGGNIPEMFSFIWSDCPNLKMITIENIDVVYQLVREYPNKVFRLNR